MQTHLIGWLGTAVAFLILDGLWLGLIAKSFYAKQLGPLMANPVRVEFAALFYIVYVTGLWALAGFRSLDTPTIMSAFWFGAAIGLIAYATYDLSNLAATRGWPVPMAFVDIAWGTLASGLAALAGRYAVEVFA